MPLSALSCSSRLAGNEVVVWQMTLSEADGLPQAETCLDGADHAQIAKYRLAADADRSRAGRVLLRHALSDVCRELAPADWQFDTGPEGKPRLVAGLPQLEFNLSHAGDRVAVAVSGGRPVGVDIEFIDANSSAGVVPDVLSKAEEARLKGMAEDERQEMFIRLWTLKEAGAKALGAGVGIDFSVLATGLDPVQLTCANSDLGEGVRFDVETKDVSAEGGRYILSVAVIAQETSKTLFNFLSPSELGLAGRAQQLNS